MEWQWNTHYQRYYYQYWDNGTKEMKIVWDTPSDNHSRTDPVSRPSVSSAASPSSTLNASGYGSTQGHSGNTPRDMGFSGQNLPYSYNTSATGSKLSQPPDTSTHNQTYVSPYQAAPTIDNRKRPQHSPTSSYTFESQYHDTAPVFGSASRSALNNVPDPHMGDWVTETRTERLDASYYVRDKTEARQFFVVGRMFSVLFTEPMGSTATKYNDSVSLVKYGETVYTQTRRFIVVKVRKEFCFACPVFTYSNRGTLKPGLRPEEHAVAYTVGQQPTLLPGEVGLMKDPIGVNTIGAPLNSASRIYFGIYHPIQFNIKVQDVGMVQSDDISNLIGYWLEEQRKA